MLLLLTIVGAHFPWPVPATLNCTQCRSSVSWTDCALNSAIQDCTGKNWSYQACYRAELTILKPASPTTKSSFTFQQGCTTQQNFCTDWDTTNMTVRQCSLCPEGSPQEPCSAGQPQLNAIDLNDGEQVEINVMVTKHGGFQGGGPMASASKQIVAKAPNGQPIAFLFLNESERPPTVTWRTLGTPKVIDFASLPGSVEVFPIGWNETVTGGVGRVGVDVCFTVLVAIITLAVTNYC